MSFKYNISLVLGSKDRKNLLKATIKSIRENGFTGTMEIIVVDGGSKDGTCNWLAKQKDIFTIIQPNYKIIDNDGISVLAHSWGEFMNIGFRFASAPWIVMVSDDLILEKGALQKGYDELVNRVSTGEKIGGGAFYFREYPRHDYYRVGLLPKDYININHGFFFRKALEEINFIEENKYNFYCADGDLAMRLNQNGWKTIALEDCFADHLVHKPSLRKEKVSPSTNRDISVFHSNYPFKQSHNSLKNRFNKTNKVGIFWKVAFLNCSFGVLLKLFDNYKGLK
jgi:glycosyltransferase involved in cell wall biosynthesis